MTKPKVLSGFAEKMNKKVIFGTVGAIILGALGSGLWELIKPFLGWLWALAITISTLGLDSLRDGMYASAGASLRNQSGLAFSIDYLTALTLVISSLVVLLIMASVRILIELRIQKDKNYAKDVKFMESGESLSSSLRLGGFVLLGLSLVFLITGARRAYIDQLASYYQTLETIAAPHVSELEIKIRRAAFVQIQNRDAYLEQIKILTLSIEAAGLKAPKAVFF